MLQCCIFQIHVSGNCPRMRQIANTSNFRFTSQALWHLREVRDSILEFTSRSPFKSPTMCLQNWTYIAESVHLRMIWPHFFALFLRPFIARMMCPEFSSVSEPLHSCRIRSLLDKRTFPMESAIFAHPALPAYGATLHSLVMNRQNVIICKR